MTEQPQPESEIWVLDPEKISPNVNIYSSPNDDVIPDDKFKWFQIILPATGDTEQERNEQRQAQMDQLRLGILKMPEQQPQPTFPHLFSQGKTAQSPAGKLDVSNIFGKQKKIGPNEPCPCGSKKKYKVCCGKHLRK